MPQVIIVGISNTDRTRDLTPSHASLPRADGTARGFPTSGGASLFLDFWQRELFTYIETNYRTQPFRILAGHSFGGLFALDTLFNHPDLFKAIISVSPSLQWDDDLPLRQARSFFADRERLDTTLFVAMANEEQGDPSPTRLDRLEQILAGAATEGFEWQVVRMPRETHGSVVLRAHYRALLRIFGPWRLPTDPETGLFSGTVSDLKAHFRRLSRRTGFRVAPPEDALNQVGYQLMARDDLEGAIAVFRYNVEIRPDSANVYDSLGEALERAGRLPEALDNYSRAVANAATSGDQRLEIFTTNRDRARARLEPEGTE